jgi:hypothetical protein
MEEILASIRRIISDDESRVATERSRGAGEERDDQFGSVAAFPGLSIPAAGFDDEVSSPDQDFSDDRFAAHEAEDVPDYDRLPAEAPAPLAPEPLVSRATDASVGQAFDLLAHTVLSGTPRPMEDVVREMLRPMLRMWLDDNLPTIVERLVRAEIERVARGGR